MSYWDKIPRLLTPKQVKLFLDMPVGVVHWLIKNDKVDVVYHKGRLKVTRESLRRLIVHKNQDAA
jgi:hypothetical protein